LSFLRTETFDSSFALGMIGSSAPTALFKACEGEWKGRVNMAETSTVIHSFLDEPRTEHYSAQNESLFVRFFRKKYKCFIIFCLAICILGESLILIFDKASAEQLNFFHKVYQSIKNQTSPICWRKNVFFNECSSPNL